MTPPLPPKLPVWNIVRESMVVTVQRAGTFFSYARPLLLLMAGIDLISAWAYFPIEMCLRANPQDVSASEAIGYGLPAVLQMVLGAALAVPWHRYIVERRIPLAGDVLSSASRVLAYTWWGLISLTVACLSMFGAALLAGLVPGDVPALEAAILLGGTALCWTAFCRFVLIFPATAVGQRVRLRSISYAMQGNAMRLAFGGLLVLLPEFVLSTGMDPSWMTGRAAYAAVMLLRMWCAGSQV